MSPATREFAKVWRWGWIKAHPVRFSGIQLHLLLRTMFAVFWLVAGIGKVLDDWLTTDILKQIFLERLTELPPDAFATAFLQHLAIPLYLPVAWVVVLGELYASVGLLLGLTTRLAASVSLFILCGFVAGGYYDASLIPFFLLNAVFLLWPSGLWLGVDRVLARNRTPRRWFR